MTTTIGSGQIDLPAMKATSFHALRASFRALRASFHALRASFRALRAPINGAEGAPTYLSLAARALKL
jgi:hypothetical protein